MTPECEHTERKKSKYAVGGVLVICCNACDPAEVIAAAKLKDADQVADAVIVLPPEAELPTVMPAWYNEWTNRMAAEALGEVEDITIEDPPEAFEDLPEQTPVWIEATPTPPDRETVMQVHKNQIAASASDVDHYAARLESARNQLRDFLAAAHADGLTWQEVAEITGKNSPQSAHSYATKGSTIPLTRKKVNK